MNKIETKERVYAQLVNPFRTIPKEFPYGGFDIPDSTSWYGKETEPLQGSVMYYPHGKTFRTHKHIMNPRLINRTQEVFIVIEGELTVDIYEEGLNDIGGEIKEIKGKFYSKLGSLTAKAGESIFVWAGFHKITLKGIAYEIKAGQFNGVISDDKEFLDE